MKLHKMKVKFVWFDDGEVPQARHVDEAVRKVYDGRNSPSVADVPLTEDKEQHYWVVASERLTTERAQEVYDSYVVEKNRGTLPPVNLDPHFEAVDYPFTSRQPTEQRKE